MEDETYIELLDSGLRNDNRSGIDFFSISRYHVSISVG
jgi:hypothetical protein